MGVVMLPVCPAFPLRVLRGGGAGCPASRSGACREGRSTAQPPRVARHHHQQRRPPDLPGAERDVRRREPQMVLTRPLPRTRQRCCLEASPGARSCAAARQGVSRPHGGLRRRRPRIGPAGARGPPRRAGHAVWAAVGADRGGLPYETHERPSRAVGLRRGRLPGRSRQGARQDTAARGPAAAWAAARRARSGCLGPPETSTAEYKCRRSPVGARDRPGVGAGSVPA